MVKANIGILGGGQLARMLALSAHPLGIDVSILTAQAADPAAQVVGHVRLGSPGDAEDLRDFLNGATALTFESEFIEMGPLRKNVPGSVYVFPNFEAIDRIQDRLTQKRLLDEFKIPTSPWRPIENETDLAAAEERFTGGFVLKQRRFGYDGYGTFVVRAERRADPLILERSAAGFIAEAFIPFKRELAISFVRSRRGEFVALPLVETVQKDSRCFSVMGPVAHPGVKKLGAQVKRMMEALDYVGVLAVEMFDTKSGLLVNELAPRVHNSAHYSQDALSCSQFEYHLRAGFDWPLPKVSLRSGGFAMVNLLGEGGEIHLSRSGLGNLHWYGKSENRPGRKLGHINVLDASGKSALRRALKWRKEFTL